MKLAPSHTVLLKTILSGGYTPLDVREFVELCYTLALPLIRKKMRIGKLNLNIIRLYAEADPTLGKVLRNIKLNLEKKKLFDEVQRFGETCLVPHGMDPLSHCAPIPLEILEQRFVQIVLLHDSLASMLEKLHTVLVTQHEYQRIVSLVNVGLLLKQVYALGWAAEESGVGMAEQLFEVDDISRTSVRICDNLKQRMFPAYVGKGKCTRDVFERYVSAVREILVQEFSGERMDGVPYFDILKNQIPALTKKEYLAQHRRIIEYLAKLAKRQMREELKKR